ncbi:MAG: FHA domain-containing protein [Gammaproteobacteria bacterium]|nr:FHA domain-containing protein [Gammaproteobacteria bacterium]NNF62123.1 FHA domain-containing protein [Gammaproteobacteria bacterium]
MIKLSPAAFRSVPDPALLYLTDQHARALAFLQLAMRMPGCLATIVGEDGCGKTLLSSAAINDAADDLNVIQLDAVGLTENQLLRETLTRLAPDEPGASPLLPGLTTVRSVLAGGRGPVLFLITSAHQLSQEVFQTLQAMSRPEKGRRRRVSIALTGQQGLETLVYTIGWNEMADWKILTAHLPPLGRQDTAGYIGHRLRMEGQDDPDQVFHSDAYAVIHQLSGGIPARINELCDRALDIANQARSGLVSAGQVRAAAHDLEWPGAGQGGVVSLSKASATPALTLSRDGEVQGIYPLELERMLIGRDAENEIPIDSPYVSRHHALIVRDERGYWLTDINSTNGTYLNGERVSDQARLGAGDHIRIGRHELVVSLPSEIATRLQGTARLNDSMADTMVDPAGLEHDPKLALSVVEEELKVHPDKIDLQFERGCLLTDLGRKEEAIGVFDRLARDHAGVPEVHNNLAVLLAERGELDQARAELEKAIRLAPGYTCAHENLGDLYLQLAGSSFRTAVADSTDQESCQMKIAGITRLLRS